jgi:hypothetical protein
MGALVIIYTFFCGQPHFQGPRKGFYSFLFTPNQISSKTDGNMMML